MTAASDAYDNFRIALQAHVDRLRGMDEVTLLARVVELCEPEAPEPTEKVVDVLERLARGGSIEAAAAAFVMGCGEKKLTESLHSFCDRLPDLKEGVQIEALAKMLEEIADEEVAAGRMTVEIGPDGRKLYSTVRGA